MEKSLIQIEQTNCLLKQDQKKTAEEMRLEKYKERQAAEAPSFTFKIQKNNGITQVYPEHPDTPMEKPEIVASSIFSATGTASKNYGMLIFEQAVSACFQYKGHDTEFMVNAVHEALLAINPADVHEGMLCSRLVALHNQYMEFMSRTVEPRQSMQVVDLNINRAAKLMRLANETLETLNRYRRKGEQKVTVQHVNVSNGGQAVINPDFAGAGITTKREGAVHAN